MALLTPNRILAYGSALAVTTWLLFITIHIRAFIIQVRPTGDFVAFYTAAYAATTHPDALYDLSAQDQTARSLLPNLSPTLRWQYLHPPFFSAIIIPFGKLSYLQAYWAWTATSIAFYAASIYLLTRNIPSARAYSAHVFLLAFSAFPFLWCIMAGQSTALGTFLWIVAFYAIKKDRTLFFGLVLGTLTYRFQSLVVLLPILILKRAWNSIAGFAVSSCFLVVVGGLILGASSYSHYLQLLVTLLHQMEQSVYPFAKSISLFGFFRLLLPHEVAVPLTLVAASILLYWLLKVWRGQIDPKDPAFDLQFSMTLMVTLLLMHHSLVYDLLLSILPVLLIYEHRSLFPRYYKLILALIYIAPYLWFLTGLQNTYFNPIQPLLFWMCYEIYTAIKKTRSDQSVQQTALSTASIQKTMVVS